MSGFSKIDVNNKIDLGPKVASYPMPVTLIGANVNGKANFLVAAWFMAAGISPPKVSVALNKMHYTNKGIKENKTFSVCLPSEDIVKATDYWRSSGCATRSSVIGNWFRPYTAMDEVNTKHSTP